MKKQTTMTRLSTQFRRQSRLVRLGIPAVVVLAVAVFGAHYVAGSYAAASYYVNDREGLQMAGSGAGANVYMYGPPESRFAWLNDGGNCQGSTCYQVEDDATHDCLMASHESTSWLVIEDPCNRTNSYQLFTSPGGSCCHYIWNQGVTVHYSNGLKWGLVQNSSNRAVYVEDDLNRWSSNYTQWFLD